VQQQQQQQCILLLEVACPDNQPLQEQQVPCRCVRVQVPCRCVRTSAGASHLFKHASQSCVHGIFLIVMSMETAQQGEQNLIQQHPPPFTRS
jgi:hypothetical protein